MSPRVLLLDEPLGALDLKLRKEMQIELKRIQDQVGITFIYVTHDQGEALSMSDRVAVMSNGVIEQLDEPRAIYDRPLTAVRGRLHRGHELPGRRGRRGGRRRLRRHRGPGRRGARPRRRPCEGTRVRVGIRPERIVAIAGAVAPGPPTRPPPRSSPRCTWATRSRSWPRCHGGTNIVVREQRAGADPALDAIHPGDQIALSWDEAAPLLLGEAAPSQHRWPAGGIMNERPGPAQHPRAARR